MGRMIQELFRYIIPCPDVTSAKHYRKELRSKQLWKGLCKCNNNSVNLSYVNPRLFTQDLSFYTGKFVYPYTRDYLFKYDIPDFNFVICNKINAHQEYYHRLKTEQLSLYTDISKDPRFKASAGTIRCYGPVYINKYDINLDPRAPMIVFENCEEIQTSLEDVDVVYKNYLRSRVRLVKGDNIFIKIHSPVHRDFSIKRIDCRKLKLYSVLPVVSFDHVKIKNTIEFYGNAITAQIKTLDLSEYKNQFFFPDLGTSIIKINKVDNPQNIPYYIDDKQNNIPDDYFKGKNIVFSTVMSKQNETWEISDTFLSNKGIVKQSQVTKSTDFFVCNRRSSKTEDNFFKARDCGTKILDILDFAKLCKTKVYL